MGSYSLSYMFYNMLYRVCSKVHLFEMNNTRGYNSYKDIDENTLFLCLTKIEKDFQRESFIFI